jgi:iron complex transport system substrate-binding protein
MGGSLSRSFAVLIVVVLAVGAGIGPMAVGGTENRVGSEPAGAIEADTTQQSGGEGCSFPVTMTDTTGSEVTIDSEPQRIVALQPSDTQTLWAIGARETVVGAQLNQYTSYLNDTEGIPNVVNQDGSVNTERVVELNPDLVLAANVTDPATIEQLRGAGLTVYAGGSPSSIEGVYDTTARYGRLAGACAGANETVTVMRDRVTAVERAVEGAERPSTLYYFYEFTAGTGTFTADIIETAGADNIAANANISGYQSISPEIVAASNPEWIIYPSGATIPAGQPWDGTTAVQRNQTVALNANYVQQPAPRLVIPLTRVARALHPDAMSEADLPPVEFGPTGTTGGASTNTTNAADESEPTVANEGNGTEASSTKAAGSGSETTDASGPGFGVLAGAIALLTAGLLARRRG